MADNRLQTIEAVQFRYGRSRGSGRGFIARLLAKPGATSDRGPALDGVESMRLERDVQIRLEGIAGGFLPGSDPGDANADTPVMVRSRGSLEFAVVSRLLTLTDSVDVSRTLPDGGVEQLACDRLSILMADGGAATGEAEPAEGLDTGGLQPVELEARGSPVVARSTSGGLEARAERLGYEMASRRILLDGEQPVLLLSPDAELEARSVDYVPGPPGSPGALMAVGPGWFESKPTVAHGPVRVTWKKWLRVRPDGDGHVASVAGDAQASFEGQGSLAASEIHLWMEMDQTPTNRPLPAGPGGVSLAGVKPSRMLARGIVETEAPQLAARSDRLEIWFRHPKPAAAPSRPAATPAATAVASAPRPAQQPRVAPPRAPLATPAPTASPGSDRGRIVATGALMRGLVDMQPEGPVVAEISLEDAVQLIEEPLPGESEPQLVIAGDQLQVVRPTGFDARATVAGRPARITGRGVELEGPLVEVDRGRNRMTVDGAGRMQLPVAGGGLGLEALATGPVSASRPVPAPNASAERLDVTWQGRMDFDGLTARFIDQVVTSSGEGTLEAGSLDVVLDRPFDFAAMSTGGSHGQADVARIACGSGVKIHNVSQTDDGSRSVERLYVRDLLIDRVTGNVLGNGPGRLENVRLGQAPGFAAPPGLNPAAAGASPPRPDELTYLGVDFQRGLSGNLGQRTLEFQQRVEAIFGPVTSWEETLDLHNAHGLPPKTVRISSDVLSVGQTPPLPGVRRGSLEMSAVGNILVEGDTFTGRSSRLSWSEAKDLIVFEGDGRSDAELYRQERVGAPTSTASAGKISYWRGLNRVDIHDARYLDLDQINASAAGFQPPGR